MPPFDVAARLCLAARRSMEWLATGTETAGIATIETDAHAPSVRAAPGGLDRTLLSSASAVLALVLGDTTVRPTDRDQLLADVYEHLLTHGMDAAHLIALGESIRARLVPSATGNGASTVRPASSALNPAGHDPSGF